MNVRVFAILAVAAWVGASVGSTASSAAEPETVRVLTFNIHRGIGMDEALDLERIAAVIRAARPDVVALQEVDRGTRRSHGVDQPAELARLTGMHATFGKAIDYDGGEYGQAILTREPPAETRTHRLPQRSEREPRVAVEVVLGEGEARWRFVGTHLDHVAGSEDRPLQVAELARLFGSGPPTVLVGDLNDRPGTPTRAALEAWTSATGGGERPTFPADQPVRQIDYVLYRPAGAWRVVEARVVEEPAASDHRPVLAVLERTGGE